MSGDISKLGNSMAKKMNCANGCHAWEKDKRDNDTITCSDCGESTQNPSMWLMDAEQDAFKKTVENEKLKSENKFLQRQLKAAADMVCLDAETYDFCGSCGAAEDCDGTKRYCKKHWLAHWEKQANNIK